MGNIVQVLIFIILIVSETQMKQYEGHNTPQGHHTNQGPKGRGQYDVLEAFCGLNTASEIFLIFTTQINAQLRHLRCTVAKD